MTPFIRIKNTYNRTHYSDEDYGNVHSGGYYIGNYDNTRSIGKYQRIRVAYHGMTEAEAMQLYAEQLPDDWALCSHDDSRMGILYAFHVPAIVNGAGDVIPLSFREIRNVNRFWIRDGYPGAIWLTENVLEMAA